MKSKQSEQRIENGAVYRRVARDTATGRFVATNKTSKKGTTIRSVRSKPGPKTVQVIRDTEKKYQKALKRLAKR